ncbi:MAG: hypothetical protein UW30_C0008G0023 [Candidatus Giovannonibacteria bacterium GW2011_GWA2_44_13b]|uniref:Uncharacterized protein n=2 Tax=Candidatus Giovannoniibacteriota TaxID=1752738 RepID=A0A0G1K0U1_9BACT|nr:MAG: hypothetical protein UW30_C0008G0023 [Candidatus Giovannonibacteria bacterium GW2011_GWA2_44_13b]OGF82672.1 MAG: hypothetical protein A2924_00715 [Candidatus Giovannonibacteria bacterium RIFCSPLOWO2_01_FULL_44_16]
MRIWEKIIFWAGAAIMISDSLIWQWIIKIGEKPISNLNMPIPRVLFSLGRRGIIIDILVIMVWLIVLVRVYRRANQRES